MKNVIHKCYNIMKPSIANRNVILLWRNVIQGDLNEYQNGSRIGKCHKNDNIIFL